MNTIVKIAVGVLLPLHRAHRRLRRVKDGAVERFGNGFTVTYNQGKVIDITKTDPRA